MGSKQEAFNRALDKAGLPSPIISGEAGAKLLETLAKEKPWCDQPWARMALAIGARAIRRGRLLTEKEKLLNLADAMEAEDVDPEMREVADKIRAAANL